MANGVYNKGKFVIGDSSLSFSADTMKVILLKTQTFDQDHNFLSQIEANRITGTTDQTLATKSVTEDDTNDFAYWDADDVVFSAVPSGETVVAAVLYKDTGVAATSPLIAYYDVTDTPTNGGDITIQWAAVGSGGVLKLA